MTNLQKYNNIVNKNVQKIKQKKFKINNDVNFWNGFAVLWSIVLFIWMFIMLLIVPNSNLSISWLNVDAFYTAKLSSDLSSYSLSLTPVWIVFIVLFIFFIGFLIFCIFNTKKNIKQIKPYKYRFVSLFSFILFSLIFLLFFIFILIPPNVGDIQNQIYTNYIIDSAINSNSMDVLKQVYQYFGISLPTNEGDYYNTLVNYLVSYKLSNNIDYTIFSTSSNSYVFFNSSIISIYVLFALGIFSIFFSFIYKFIYINKSSVAPSITKENIKLMVAAYKQNKKDRKKLRKNKKKLLEEENKLLQNLYEVDLPNSDDMMKKQVAISQLELEQKVNKNTELKKQLEDLVKQKEELKKESLKKSKLKSFINKLQENNISKAKNKKQEIAIPDQELEEIFKSLDIE